LSLAAGDDRRLKRDEFRRTEPGDGPAWPRSRDRRSIGRADDIDGVVFVGHTQGNAAAGIGSDVVGDHTSRALCSEHEMNTEASAPLGNTYEGVQKVGEFRGERGELIDHNQQAGQRLPRRLDGTKGCDVLGADRSEPVLAVSQLGLQAVQGPSSQRLIEVGDESGYVRQPATAVERGTALVVDQNEGAVIGVVGGRQPSNERSQEFRLS
jgi:hypothetical protein